MGLPDCCIVNTGDFLNLSQCQNSTTRKPRCRKEPRDIAGVLGLNFANIIHYRPKVNMVGLTCKDSKVLTSDSRKLPLSTAPLSFDAPS